MLGFQGKVLQFLVFFFSFSCFSSSSFSTGVLNLLKVVNNTRIGYCKVKEVAQFFSLSLKPNVLGVWLAKGGRKMSKSIRIQLIIHSTKHGTNLASIEFGQSLNFSNYELGKTHKNFGCKSGSKF